MTEDDLKNRVLNYGRGSGQSLRLLIGSFESKIAGLEQQIEKMKCCGNCKHYTEDVYSRPVCEFDEGYGWTKTCHNFDKWEFREREE